MMWKTGVAERYFEMLQNIEDDGENDNDNEGTTPKTMMTIMNLYSS